METRILHVDSKRFDSQILQPAAMALRDGGLVAFPTETVYGLGGNIEDAAALRWIFEVKGRPVDNPLILHIWRVEQLERIAAEINTKAKRLMAAFWPGPLTLIFPKQPEISPLVTAGLDTVAVRMPVHPVARELLRLTDIPVAAPSANLSGKPSPTRGEHVIEDLSEKIPWIIDAGPCETGIESTVLIFDNEKPVVLRPGAVTREMLEMTLGEKVEEVALGNVERPQAPGMKYRHYAPQAPLTLVEGEAHSVMAVIKRLIRENEIRFQKTVVICFSEHIREYDGQTVLDLGPRSQPEMAAARLYDLLRRCDQLEADRILIEGLDKTGIGTAVGNRLYKAAGGNVIHVP